MSTISIAFVKEREGSKWMSVKDAADKWYSYDKNKLSLAKGKSYEIETTSTEKDGKTYYTITSAKERSSGGGADGASGDRWWINAVSNWTAHAIASGHITEPAMLKTWAAAAKTALLELDAPVKKRDEDLPDDIPFN